MREKLGAPELQFLGRGPWSHIPDMQNILIVQRHGIWLLGRASQRSQSQLPGQLSSKLF